MHQHHRREFLTNVGRGMLTATLGYSAALDMGLTSRVWANDDSEIPLDFGPLEPLAALMQETPADRLLPRLHQELLKGTPLKTLVAAGVLANSRSFGGEDYIGFHTLMALAPSLLMAQELPTPQQALPVFKVLHRNATRMQETGGRSTEALHQLPPVTAINPQPETVLRDACRQQDNAEAERLLSHAVAYSPELAWDQLLREVEDETEVHRVNLAYRAWDLLGIVGKEHALTLLRQSLRYCLKAEKQPRPETRTLLARLFDTYALEGKTPGTRTLSDPELATLSESFLQGPPDRAADTAAAAMADGLAPDMICQAASIAANQLLLRDTGRPAKWSDARKPAGSVHGDSIGVHSSDAVNAWRNIARVSPPRHQIAAAILAAYQVARDRASWTDYLTTDLAPHAEQLEQLRDLTPEKLLTSAETAIRGNQQLAAAAAVHLYGTQTSDVRPVFDLLRKYAISEDGALHAEKFYATVRQEYATLPAAFRLRQLTGLARVTASEYGYTAPGYAEACELLGTPRT